jgi:hypothetical protein
MFSCQHATGPVVAVKEDTSKDESESSFRVAFCL